MKKQRNTRVYTESSALAVRPTSVFRFRVPNDDLKHFKLSKGDIVQLKPVSSWDDVEDDQICLAQHYLNGKLSLAVIRRPGPEYSYGRQKHTDLIECHFGFFRSPNIAAKTAYEPIGVVIENENEADEIDLVASAISVLLTKPEVPSFLRQQVQEAVCEVFNNLTADRKLKLDRFTDESKIPYNRRLIELCAEQAARGETRVSSRRREVGYA